MVLYQGKVDASAVNQLLYHLAVGASAILGVEPRGRATSDDEGVQAISSQTTDTVTIIYPYSPLTGLMPYAHYWCNVCGDRRSWRMLVLVRVPRSRKWRP